MLCRCRPRTHHDNGGGVCVSFPGEGRIELVNERGKRKAWAFDQVLNAYASLVRSVIFGFSSKFAASAGGRLKRSPSPEASAACVS